MSMFSWTIVVYNSFDSEVTQTQKRNLKPLRQETWWGFIFRARESIAMIRKPKFTKFARSWFSDKFDLKTKRDGLEWCVSVTGFCRGVQEWHVRSCFWTLNINTQMVQKLKLYSDWNNCKISRFLAHRNHVSIFHVICYYGFFGIQDLYFCSTKPVLWLFKGNAIHRNHE